MLAARGASRSCGLRLRETVRQLKESVAGNPNCPLHQYKVHDELLAEMEHLLFERLGQSCLRLSQSEAAAFVFYCAHHFTRTYTGGHWTWTVAKGAIDPEDRLGPPHLYKIVDDGLRVWGRRVHWNGRHHEYLYTVGREGGLPLSVLAYDRGEGLRGFLQGILSRVESSNVSAYDCAVELTHCLPAQLQQPEIVRLAAELVTRIAELRGLVPEDTEPSLEWFDLHHSGWRSHLPLGATDTVAAALIAGLVHQKRPSIREQGFSLVTQLVNGRLQRTLQQPKRLTREEFKALIGDVDHPGRLRIAVTNGRVHSVRGMAMRVGDEYSFERLQSEPLRGRSWLSDEVRLVVGVGERELANCALIGGEAEVESPLPWVFESDGVGGSWLLVARGSYTSKSASLLVAHAAGKGTLSATSGGLEPVGEEPTFGWRLTCVSGAARWASDEDTCEIVSGAAAGRTRFELRGSSERLAGGGSFVWRGCPSVYSNSLQGPAVRVHERSIEWRPTASADPWRRLDDACQGDVQLRVREATQTLYRARLCVVPRDFRLELSARDGAAGTLLVFGARVNSARVLTQAVDVSVEREQSCFRLELSSPHPPAELELEVCLGGKTRLVLRVPFPSEFRGFVSNEGRPLPKQGRIGVDALSRWTARAVSCDPKQRFVLEAETERGFRAIAELPVLSPGLAELPLLRVRSTLEACLSGTRSIDAFVALRVSRFAGVVATARSRVEARLGWHEAQLRVDFDADSATVELSQELSAQLEDWQLRDFRVLARPLYHPAAEPIALEGNAQGGWFFSPGHERLWLLSGWVGNALLTRPRLVQLEDLYSSRRPVAIAALGGEASLDTAMRLPTLDLRREALSVVYRALAQDFAHEDWNRVDDFLLTLHELPPPTYDVVCALAAAKPAAVVALLRQPAEHFSVVWNGLEELGVSWQTIPIGLWLRAARLGRDFAFNNPQADLFGGKDQLLKHALSGLLGQLQNGPRFFPILLAALNSYRSGFPATREVYLQLARAREGRLLLKQQVRAAWAELRRRAGSTGERFPPVRVSTYCSGKRDGLTRLNVARAGSDRPCIAGRRSSHA